MPLYAAGLWLAVNIAAGRVEAARREVAEVGGRKPEVDDVGTGHGGSLDERGDERLRRGARVAPDEHPLRRR